MKSASHLEFQAFPWLPTDLDTTVDLNLSNRAHTEYLELVPGTTVTIERGASFSEEEREILQSALSAILLPSQSNFTSLHPRARPKAIESLLPTAISICIKRNWEEVACRIIPHITEAFPLYLVHRAGERGLLTILRSLLDYQIQIKASRCLRTTALRLLPKHRRSDCTFPLFSHSRVLTPNDILRWACLTKKEDIVKKTLSSGLDFDARQVVRQLVTEGFEELLVSLLDSGKLDFSRLVLLTLLELSRMQLIVRLSSKWVSFFRRETPRLLTSAKVQWKLLDLCERADTAADAFYLMSFVQPEDFERVTVERLYDALSLYKDGKNMEKNVLVNHWNPICLCVIASELCDSVSTCSLTYRDRFEELAASLRTLAAAIQDLYTDYTDLKELYTEQLYGSKCLMDIVVAKAEKYRSLLMKRAVVSVAEDLWRGQVRPGFGIHNCLVSLSFLTRFTEARDMWRMHRLFKPKFATPSFFQYRFWQRDGFIRYALETFCLLSVFVILMNILVTYLQESEDGVDPAGMNAEDLFVIAYTMLLVLHHVQILCLEMFLKETPSFDIRLPLDVGLCFLAIEIEDLQSGSILFDFNPDTSIYVLELFSGIFYLFAGLRITIVLLRTRTFGPILRMIYVISLDISSYLFIYALTILSFSMLFASTLWRIPAFSTIQTTIRTLFHWGIAGLDLDQLTSKPELASVLGITWTLISAVFMLNLMIAVLSARYEELVPQARADFACIVYQSYKQTRCESDYSSLVIAPAPFNCLTLPAIPFFYFLPSKAALVNKCFSILSYQVMFCIGILCFVAYASVISPCIYVYVAVASAKKLGWRRAWMLVAWMLFGPAYLLFLAVSSLRIIARYMYHYEKESIENEFDFIDNLQKSLIRITNKSPGDAILPFTEVLNSIKSKIDEQPMPMPKTQKGNAGAKFFAKSLANLRWKKAEKFLSRFISVPREKEEKMINLTRAVSIIARLKATPRLLTAVHIASTQQVLSHLIDR